MIRCWDNYLAFLFYISVHKAPLFDKLFVLEGSVYTDYLIYTVQEQEVIQGAFSRRFKYDQDTTKTSLFWLELVVAYNMVGGVLTLYLATSTIGCICSS